MTIEPNGETVTSADIARERQLSARGMDPLIERHVAHLTGGTSQDAILEYLAALAAPAAVNFDIDLTKNFIGTEWAASESNVHGQTWRWLGQNSTIYARVRPGANYEIKLHIHTATSEEAFQGLTVLVNDQPLLDPFLRRDEGGCYLSGTICGDAIGSGALRLAISTVGEQLRTVAFSRLSVDETFVVEQSRPSIRRHASANA